MNHTIRFAQADDLKSLRALDPYSSVIKADFIENKIARQEVIVADIANKLSGFLKFSYIWGSRPYIDLIWLLPEQRGRQLGSDLLAYLEKYLRQNKFAYLHSSYEDDAQGARHWHQKNSFLPCGYNEALNFPDKTCKEIFVYKKL